MISSQDHLLNYICKTPFPNKVTFTVFRGEDAAISFVGASQLQLLPNPPQPIDLPGVKVCILELLSLPNYFEMTSLEGRRNY